MNKQRASVNSTYIKIKSTCGRAGFETVIKSGSCNEVAEAFKKVYKYVKSCSHRDTGKNLEIKITEM